MRAETHRRKAIKLVSALALARRNRNIKAEQRAYDKLREFCHAKGYDIAEVINGGMKALQYSVAAIMNSLV